MSRTIVRTRLRKFSAGTFVIREDNLAGEEPLEIRVNGTALATTMRTPGNDIELVHGFLFAEGVIGGRDDVRIARYCDGVDEQGRNTFNVIDVELAAGVADPSSSRRRLVAGNSACGICGSSSIEAIMADSRYPSPTGPLVDPELILRFPDRLQAAQQGFERTGGLHATGLFGSAGELILSREDVGRHNAMDKVIGASLLAGALPLHESVLVTSSRASFELVQKAVLAGCGMLVAVSAPSSLAVDLARKSGLTLIGFTRAENFNLYSGAARVVGA